MMQNTVLKRKSNARDLPVFKMESPRKKPKLHDDSDYALPSKKSEKESPKVGKRSVYLYNVAADLTHRKYLWRTVAHLTILTPLSLQHPFLPLLSGMSVTP